MSTLLENVEMKGPLWVNTFLAYAILCTLVLFALGFTGFETGDHAECICLFINALRWKMRKLERTLDMARRVHI
jgi:hypothetical protein